MNTKTDFKNSIFIYLMAFVLVSNAQNVALGTWTAHLPLSNAISVCQSKDYIYAACEYGVIGVNADNHFTEKYTKVSGLADVMPSQVGYDTATSTLVIAYKNSDIDLIHHGKISNIPYLKNASIIGDKSIQSIFCTQGIAYIATGFGIVKIDLTKKEVAESYPFNDGVQPMRVNAIWADENAIYAATQSGIVKGIIAPNVNLLDYNNWIKYSIGIPQNNASAITPFQGKIIASVGNTIYQFDGVNWSAIFTEPNWESMQLNNSNGQLLVAQQQKIGSNYVDGRIGVWNGTTFTFFSGVANMSRPLQILQDKNGKIWYADLFRGLVQKIENNYMAIIPNGPSSIANKEMDFLNETLWVSSSTIGNGWNPTNLAPNNFFYKCDDYDWESYLQYQHPTLDSFTQIAVVKTLPQENKVIFGAAGYSEGGILEFNPSDNSFKIQKYAPNINESFRITGADLDAQGNMWFSNAYSNAPLICRKTNGEYVYFNSGFLNGKLNKDVVVDDYNQIWVAKEDGSGGLVILNYGNDIDDKTDDQFYNLAAGSGYGNLPVNNVNCMVKDAEGIIWLGTSQGIAIIGCAAYVSEFACEAEQICIDRKDGSEFCDYLLEDEVINCIAIDAANRKWIGTNNGIFLVSPEGSKTIHYFNATSSPLLSNTIRSIAIRPQTGDVFIGTDKGICSFRADATLTTSESEVAFVYPNPVRADYSGVIAFKGIPNNCNVKIVDVSGNLVYETTANGGQATWDGNLINGNRAASGVYYALCKGNGKKETAKLKFVLIH